MCPHDEFKIVYYKDGIMLRQCSHCGGVEVRLDYIWEDAARVATALLVALEGILSGAVIIKWPASERMEALKAAFAAYK